MRDKFLPFSRPFVGAEEISGVIECLESGWITSGPKVLKFETLFAEYVQAPHAVSCTSATAGWQLVLKAIGIGPGDEVILPSITWPSMANMVELAGAIPVFADVDSHTMQIDLDSVKRCITSQTKAIVPVHFAGAPCDLDALEDMTANTSIVIIEDAAHAIGTSYRSKPIGSGGRIAIFSFHAIKNMTTGEGGMITCHSDALVSRLRLLRSHGITRDTWARTSGMSTPSYDLTEPGYKLNMMDLQAVLGIAQLEKLDGMNARRRELFALYDQLLADSHWLSPLHSVQYAHTHSCHLYIVRLNLTSIKISRDQFIDQLCKRNIGAGLHFPASHLLKFYREKYGYTELDLPGAVNAGKSVLSLPLYPGMQDSDVHDVADAIHDIYEIHKNA